MQCDADAPFPIASTRDFLALYPARADALELRWRLTGLGGAASDRVIAAEETVAPSVRLRRFVGQTSDDEDGGDLMPVATVQQGCLGLVGLQTDAWYQAEIGFGNPQGAWLMLARSNRLALPGSMEPHSLADRSPDRPRAPDSRVTGESAEVMLSTTAASAPIIANPQVACADEDSGLTPVAGSGPLRSIAASAKTALWGDLRIQGQAPPGSALELGGHPYQVGPGGHFAFDVKITDPQLIHALLRLLPTLPVVSREED
ncbi:hypothetical protein CKO36_08005 [Rhabdochromatium marinum]|nr:hypothetical protein [Rhabdochromatium marinum]